MSVRSGPRPVGERLRRLLIMLPWLMERGEVSVAETVERFQMTERDLVKDLELVAMCGLPPFIDEMIDVFIDDGMIYTGVARVFTAQLALTAPEGFALLASGRTALQLPGADPQGSLARALDKLERTLDQRSADAASEHRGNETLVIDNDQPSALSAVTEAVQVCERLQIHYRSATDQETTIRTITPLLMFTDRGRWYVVADDDRSGTERTFRIDRIQSWKGTGEFGVTRPVEVPTEQGWFAEAELPIAVFRVPEHLSWLFERYPVRQQMTLDDGRIEVHLVVTSEAWLRALLLRMGPSAELVEPDRWIGLAGSAAAQILNAYQ